MNRQWFAGGCLQFSGMMNQAWGQLTGDPARVVVGRHDQIVGKTQQAVGIEQQKSDRQLKDFQHRNRNWNC